MEWANELLANQVFMIKREVFYDTEDDRICKDAGVEQMDGVVG